MWVKVRHFGRRLVDMSVLVGSVLSVILTDAQVNEWDEAVEQTGVCRNVCIDDQAAWQARLDWEDVSRWQLNLTKREQDRPERTVQSAMRITAVDANLRQSAELVGSMVSTGFVY
eukprot:6064345-Amphidinium_carterae.1